jgi:dihydrofolate synthase/folylpolyglutamate synthase
VDHREATEYLLDLELFGMRFGLERMHRLMTALGMPQRRYASIHVVGTNGKSSTTRMIAAILQAHGMAAGSYTSPHLTGYAERIEVGGAQIPDSDFAAAVTRVRAAAELVNRTVEPDDDVTQFEALTAAAFHELARRKVEVAVIEAGLGGRYDATNVIPSKVQVLTGVALDHTRWLGNTITAIAEEKLAVVRDHATLVTGALHPEAEAVARRVCAERHARRVHSGDDAGVAVTAAGAMQKRNFALAAAAAGAFLGREPDRSALETAAAVELPGRLEVVSRDPLVIHDGAHNPDAAAALAESLPALVGERSVVGVIGILDDKDSIGILEPLLPLLSAAVFTKPANPRALPPATLQSLASKIRDVPAEIVADPRAAVARAAELAGPGGAVLATGSLHLVADLVREDPSARASVL